MRRFISTFDRIDSRRFNLDSLGRPSARANSAQSPSLADSALPLSWTGSVRPSLQTDSTWTIIISQLGSTFVVGQLDSILNLDRLDSIVVCRVDMSEISNFLKFWVFETLPFYSFEYLLKYFELKFLSNYFI